MSFSAAAVRRAIRDVLEGSSGTVRTMTAGVMEANVFDGQQAAAVKAKALQATHVFDVRIANLRNHEASPVGAIGSYRLARADVFVEVTTRTATVVQLSARDTTLAAIASDMDDAIQALAFPRNVEQTAALAATGIVSGLLQGPGGEGSPEWAEVTQDWEAQLIKSRITATATLRVRQVTFPDSEPLSIFPTSMRAWYRGDQYEDAVFVQNISSWTDLSERATALTPPVLSSQTLLVDLSTSLGQASAISVGTLFGLGNDYRVEGAAQVLDASDPPNVLIVGRFTQVDAGVISRIVDAVDGGGSVVFRAIKNAADNIAYQVGATTVATSTAADTSAHLFEFLHDGTSARVSVDDATATVGAAAPLNAAAAELGVPTTSSSNCAAFEYWDVLVLDSYPTAAQRTAYRQYVVDRYGLSITP